MKTQVWRNRFLLGGAIAIGAYLLYATNFLEHSPELPQFSKGSAQAPVALRSSEIPKITGDGSFLESFFQIQLYNGTNWTIARVDVTLKKIKTLESRRFRLSPDTKLDPGTTGRTAINVELMKPYSKGTFQADIGDFLEGVEEGQWSWSITQAFGFCE